MRKDTGTTTPVWADLRPPEAEPLEGDTQADICVIGAGIAGLTVAYKLGAAGKSVIVLEDKTIGGGETGRTTAHLSCALDDRYFNLEKTRGKAISQLAATSHTAAISEIESIVAREAIDCDFERVDGFLFVPPKRSTRVLGRELKAARRAGLSEVELVDHAPLSNFETGPCLRFPNQAQFHPMKYLTGLAEAIRKQGGRIFTAAHVTEVKGGSPARVVTKRNNTIVAEAVVVATNSPITDVVSTHTKQFPYRTYAIAASIPPDSVPRALYWDTVDPYHYIRLSDNETIIVGGEDHKTGQDEDPAKRFLRLERWARKRFPIREVQRRWSGQVLETLDGLAAIGKDPSGLENVYIVTGDSGMGMTHGTIAGLILPDLIMGRENSWTETYDPSRKPLRGMVEFVKENVNVAAQYADWLTGGDVTAIEQIPAGEGALLREGASKLAIYRGEDGQVHAMSAACTHLGCVVQWNGVEKSWDCPCHGSRFSAVGKVISGPATSDLTAANVRKVA